MTQCMLCLPISYVLVPISVLHYTAAADAAAATTTTIATTSTTTSTAIFVTLANQPEVGPGHLRK